MNLVSEKIQAVYAGNEAYMNIIGRVSVRQYSGEPVNAGQLSAILHAAMSAPSGVNRQPWEIGRAHV